MERDDFEITPLKMIGRLLIIVSFILYLTARSWVGEPLLGIFEKSGPINSEMGWINVIFGGSALIAGVLLVKD